MVKIELSIGRADTLGELKADVIHDVAVVRISRDTTENGVGRMYVLSYVHFVINPDTGFISSSAITPFESAIVTSDAYLFGYPSAIGVPNLPQLDYTQPLIRRGIIAGKNYAKKTIIIDCMVYPGNSGGPVFEIDEVPEGKSFRLIGLVSEFIPFEDIWVNQRFGIANHQWLNSGYGVVVPVDFMLDLMR